MITVIKKIPLIIIALVILVVANYFLVTLVASSYLDTDRISPHTVGLVFGTSKSTIYGGKNIFFYKRIEHAVKLFQEGKIEYILVS